LLGGVVLAHTLIMTRGCDSHDAIGSCQGL
jgi:hypothetical protein